MDKQEFLKRLRKGLSGLSRRELEERLGFYSEMIDDRVEEGLSEEEAVLAVGSVDEIVSQIKRESLCGTNIKVRRELRWWEIVFLVLGSPVWLSLLVAAFSVVIAAFASLWSVIVSLWAVFASLLGCAFAGVVSGIVLSFIGYSLPGIAMSCAGIVCAGLSIFAFLGGNIATKGTVTLTKRSVELIKKCFTVKEAAK